MLDVLVDRRLLMCCRCKMTKVTVMCEIMPGSLGCHLDAGVMAMCSSCSEALAHFLSGSGRNTAGPSHSETCRPAGTMSASKGRPE